MTSADFSNKHLGAGGATIVAAWISHKDKEAILSVNLLKNRIPVWQAKELVRIMQAKENLTTLCGLSGEETELNFSGQELGAGDALLIANNISAMGALTKLDASDNDMFGLTDKIGITAWAAALKACTSITVLNLAKNNINTNDTKILAPAIGDMGALTSLNLASNRIGGYFDDRSGDFIATPEGIAVLNQIVHSTYRFSYRCCYIRSCCYR
jgi:hypothetical protein